MNSIFGQAADAKYYFDPQRAVGGGPMEYAGNYHGQSKFVPAGTPTGLIPLSGAAPCCESQCASYSGPAKRAKCLAACTGSSTSDQCKAACKSLPVGYRGRCKTACSTCNTPSVTFDAMAPSGGGGGSSMNIVLGVAAIGAVGYIAWRLLKKQ